MKPIFSEGELYVQKLAGEDAIAQTRTPMALSSQLHSFSANFIKNQLLFNVTSTDANNNVWISMLSGTPNFITVLDYKTIKIDKTLIVSPTEDIFFTNIQSNKQVGLLFIDWETSRRYRLNGSIKEEGTDLVITIQETYGICPKYIQKRSFEYTNLSTIPTLISKGNLLNDKHKKLINHANTFFLGTSGASKKVDASHKGGKPGFVSFINNDTIRIPDYPGNSMFNSLGNLYENPNAGLIFMDYNTNMMLQLTGKGQIQFNQTTTNDLTKSGNTGRFWLFTIDSWILTENFNQINWNFIGFSPFNP